MEQAKSNGGEINVLISSLSTINSKYAEKNVKQTYLMELDNGDEISHENGLFTNYPIVQLTRQKLAKSGEKVDYLFEISSPATKEIVNIEGLSEYSGKSVVEWLDKWLKESDDSEHGPVPEIIPFDISDDPNSEETIRIINDIRQKLERIQQDTKKTINIYIDGQGGRRHTVYSLIMSVYIWEREESSNIRIKEIFNLNFDQDKDVYWIHDYKERYNAVQLYSAIDEFINYGKSTALTSYMTPVLSRSIKDVDQDEQLKNDIQRCLNVMKLFSDDLQLCRSGKIAGDIKNFRGVTETFCNRYYSVENYYITSFITALEMIRKEFDELQEDADEVDIIRWCIDKDFIQQAITFCSERSIEYLFDKKSKIVDFGNAYSKQEIRKNDNHHDYSDAYNIINKINDRHANRYCTWFERGCRSVEEEKKEKEKRRDAWEEAANKVSALDAIDENKVNSYINDALNVDEIRLIKEVAEKMPFKNNNEVDRFINAYDLPKKIRSDKCFVTGKKKTKRNIYELLENKDLNISTVVDELLRVIKEDRYHKLRSKVKAEIKQMEGESDLTALDSARGERFERLYGYILWSMERSKQRQEKVYDWEKFHKNKYSLWFFNEYFSELEKVIQGENRKQRIERLQKYLFESVFNDRSVAALFDIGALRSDDPHKATKCIYWYKLIKAQRNLSNHAVDTNGDADFDMTAEELRKTISIYLDLIRPEDKDESTEETTTVKM